MITKQQIEDALIYNQSRIASDGWYETFMYSEIKHSNSWERIPSIIEVRSRFTIEANTIVKGSDAIPQALRDVAKYMHGHMYSELHHELKYLHYLINSGRREKCLTFISKILEKFESER